MSKSKFKIVPRKKQVLVRPDEDASRVTLTGLYRPDTVEQEKKAIGTVVAVSPEVKDIKVGDRVVYGVFAGDPINVDRVDYKFLDEEFILGFLMD